MPFIRCMDKGPSVIQLSWYHPAHASLDSPEGRIRLRPHYVVLQMTFATSRKFLNCQDNKRNGHISRYDSRAAGPRSGSYADVRIALTRSWPAGGSRTVQADPAFFLFANVPKRAGVHF